MMNVIKAVWVAKYLLIATISLILITIYFFAVFSVLVLKNDYDKTLSGSCENVWFCSVTIFDLWHKADGGVGGWLDEEAPSLSSGDEYNADGARIFFDFAFNFIFGMLLLEIFSGIITDTFGKIRTEQEELNSIRESRCFVCDKDGKEFANFKFHTQYEHNLWDYIIYLFTLIYSKDNKYQDAKKLKGEGYSWVKNEINDEGKIVKFKYQVNVKEMEYLEAIIEKKLLIDNSDDYVRACLAHYELASDGNTTPLEMKRYLSWLPYNFISMEETRMEKCIKSNLEENAKSTREEFEKKVEEIFELKVKELENRVNEMDKKTNEMDENMNKKMNEMKEMMAKILNILENSRNQSLC
jgi:hypothetical protein